MGVSLPLRVFLVCHEVQKIDSRRMIQLPCVYMCNRLSTDVSHVQAECPKLVALRVNPD